MLRGARACASDCSSTAVRRRALLASCAASPLLASRAAHAAAASILFQNTAPAPPLGKVDPVFAASLSAAVDATRAALNVLPDTAFQLAFNKLFRREWPYYQANHAAALPAFPDLAGESTGLGNPLYYNFVAYCQLKVLAANLPQDSRPAFASELGRRLLAVAGAQPLPAGADDASLRAAVRSLCDAFVAGGYMAAFSLAWGEPALATLPRRDDALRAATEPASGAARRFTLRLEAPADLAGGVALRAEEGGWWPAPVPCALAALLASAAPGAVIDELYFQDAWAAPPRLQDRLLLALGDPFFSVDVPFVPDTLVMDVIL